MIADEFADIKANWDKIRAKTDAAIAGESEKAADVADVADVQPTESVEINHYPAPPNPGWANIYDTAPSDYMGYKVRSVTIREVADDA